MIAESNPLLDALIDYYSPATPDKRGNVHVPCPACGRPPKPKQVHFSFCERGGHCFVCDFSATLAGLAERVLGGSIAVGYTPHVKEVPEPMQWQSCADVVLESMHNEPGALAAWQKYRPFTQATFDRWQLGIGRLWFRNEETKKEYPSSHNRLVYPIIVHGQIIGFRGRAYHHEDRGAKWINATNSQTALIGLELVRSGSTVVVCESPVDAMLAMQVNPSIVAIASTAGAHSWRRDWTSEIAQRKPKRIIIWHDHDFAGNCPIDGKHYKRCDVCQSEHAKWRLEHPNATQSPQSSLPKLWRELQHVGCKISVYDWPIDTPPKADLGWALMHKG